MKRIIAIILAVLLLPTLPSCQAPEKSGNIKIVCTLFPQYDWVMNILGEQAESIDLSLLAPGQDLHSYEASAADIAAISQSDLFIYIGSESESWIEDALKITQNSQRKAIALSESIPLQALPHLHTEEDHHHSYDEHIWLSVRNAQKAVDALLKEIIALDPAHEVEYTANASAYQARLQQMDQAYEAAIGQEEETTIVIADRYPFRYLAEDYGLTCYAAFDGCSAETEAGAATILQLAQKVDENNLGAVMILDQSKPDLAQTVIESTRDKNQTILRLNSMQAVTAKEIEEGISYLEIMNENLHALKIALGKGE